MKIVDEQCQKHGIKAGQQLFNFVLCNFCFFFVNTFLMVIYLQKYLVRVYVSIKKINNKKKIIKKKFVLFV